MASSQVRATREAVIAAFMALPQGTAITTLGLAWLLGCPEYPVRGAVTWLALGGILQVTGEYQRRDSHGKRYGTRLYCWTGRRDIQRIPRNPSERKCQAEQDGISLASAWLSRKWI